MGLLVSVSTGLGQEPGILIEEVEWLNSEEVGLAASGPSGQDYAIEVSDDLHGWTILATVRSIGGTIDFVDSGARFVRHRYYRIRQLADPALLTGDHVAAEGGDLVIHPVTHASVVLAWNGIVIYADPDGGGELYRSLPKADWVLLTHEHGDHLDTATLGSVITDQTQILATTTVNGRLSRSLQARTIVLANGESHQSGAIHIEAVPAYNTTRSRLSYHPRGAGNGYVVSLGGRRIYVSGDTEDTEEMRALREIDVAFLCMNIPFTMTVQQAADAVKVFQPQIVYPYHYRGSDVELFKALVGSQEGNASEVRLRAWY